MTYLTPDILQLVPYYIPEVTGGAKYVHQLNLALKEKGYRVAVAMPAQADKNMAC